MYFISSNTNSAFKSGSSKVPETERFPVALPLSKLSDQKLFIIKTSALSKSKSKLYISSLKLLAPVTIILLLPMDNSRGSSIFR